MLADNYSIIQDVTQRILTNISSFFPKIRCRPIRYHMTQLEIDYWSFTWSVDFTFPSQNDTIGVFVKVPRVDWSDNLIAHAVADANARRMARVEFENLVRLDAFARKLGKGFSAIRPLAYWPEFNTIITEKKSGVDLHPLCRTTDLMAKLTLNIPPSIRTRRLLRQCGTWLCCFHREFEPAWNEVLDATMVLNQLTEDIYSYARHLTNAFWKSERFSILLDQLDSEDALGKTQLGPSVQGFELWNVFVEGDEICVLDPGEIQQRPIFTDIARFLVSLDILYWATPWFVLRLKPSHHLADAFLEGYFGRERIPWRMLRYFVIRELLRQRHDAYVVLEKAKSYPRLLEWFLRTLYIDGFYCQEITRHLRLLEAQQ